MPSECHKKGENVELRDTLFLIPKRLNKSYVFPTKVLYREVDQSKVCFVVRGESLNRDCCKTGYFHCDIVIQGNVQKKHSLVMDKETLSKHDVVLLYNISEGCCKPSQLFKSSPEIHKFLQDDICGNNMRTAKATDNEDRKGVAGTKYNFTVSPKEGRRCVSFKPRKTTSTMIPTTTETTSTMIPTTETTSTMIPTTETTSTMIPTTTETTSTMIPTTTETTSTMIPTTETTSTMIPTTTATTSTMIPTTTETTSTVIPTTETTSTMIPTTETTSTMIPTTETTSTMIPTTETTSTMIPTTTETTSTMIPTTETTSTMIPTTATTSTMIPTTTETTSTVIPTTETTSTMIPTTTETTSTMIPTTETTSTMIPTTTATTSTVIPTTESNNIPSFQNALNIMNNLSSIVEQLELSTVENIIQGDIKGVITKLPSKAQSGIDIGITTSGDANVGKDDSNLDFYRWVHIPKDVIQIASGKRNNSFVAVVLFPGMHQDDPSSTFVKDEVVGIEMGTEISNLSQTIDIHYRDVDKNGSIASCRSWDGKGEVPIWITDGCLTKETTNSITCQCSHLTFFAILLSPPPQNISSSDFTALTYITSIGCGLSIFFLTVALFMHCLLRKEKATHATKIMINLFVAVLTLNLSFLVNESVANMENFAACLAMAAAMHYAMLATFTWFFIEALHLYLTIWKLSTEIKHYMKKVCAAGWGIPAIVVVALLILKKYNNIAINTGNAGNSVKMCWIPDEAVHQGVNVGYYAVVFIFTFAVFIATMQRMITLQTKAGKDQGDSSIKIKSLSVFGLFLLLGITWVFAFFSFGPLLIPSYYIFTTLNSFQGFGLFIYYCSSRRSAAKDTSISDGSTATSNTAVKIL
ncbi:uncharacterized protein V6R79_022342 [Siganus canaliculatus]